MSGLLTRINFFFRPFACRLLGHVKADVSLRSVGLRICRRCLIVTEQKTVRARVTRREIEQRMAAFPPDGYRFVDCNWKKRKAKFVRPNGLLKYINF